MEEKFKQFTRGAWRLFWRAVKDADVVLEVLDPRDPDSFRLKNIERKLVEMGKKIILVINKSDLVPKDVVEAWKNLFEKECPTVYISARKRLGTRKLRKLIIKLGGKKDLIYVAVVGYPNVGKSTIINILKGSHSAPTGAKPGLTRHLQLIRRGRIKIIDTPGVFPIEDPISLVYKGSIRVEQLEDPIHYCEELIKKILEIDSSAFERNYEINAKDPIDIIREFAKKRNKLKKGGELDLETAARILIKEWQDGKLIVWRKPTSKSRNSSSNGVD